MDQHFRPSVRPGRKICRPAKTIQMKPRRRRRDWTQNAAGRRISLDQPYPMISSTSLGGFTAFAPTLIARLSISFASANAFKSLA